MSNSTVQGATATPSATSTISSNPIFYQLSWENWNDEDGSIEVGLFKKKKEDGSKISAQDFFVAGTDSKGNHLFIAREPGNIVTTAPASFTDNNLTQLSSAGEYHPADVTNCGRMVDFDKKEKTITSGYQVLVAKAVDLATLESLDGVYALNWTDWSPENTIIPQMKILQLGTMANGTALYACRANANTSSDADGTILGWYQSGAKEAFMPFENKAETRTQFQLLTLQPLLEYLTGDLGIASQPITSTTSAKPKLGSAKGSLSTQDLLNIKGSLMAQVVHLARKYDTGDEVSLANLNTPLYTQEHAPGGTYTLEFKLKTAVETQMAKFLSTQFAPDRYVILSSESTDAAYGQGNIYIGIAGTLADFDDQTFASVSDWMINGGAGQVTYPIMAPYAKAHGGFMLSLSSISGHHVTNDDRYTFNLENPMFSQVNDLVNQFIGSQYHQVNLYISGHSQGGAVATLMAPILSSLLSQEYGDQIALRTEVYTFGAPRSCNEYLASHYMNMVDACYRFENLGDPVPSVPPSKYGPIGSTIAVFELSLTLLKPILIQLGVKEVDTIYTYITNTKAKAASADFYAILGDLITKAGTGIVDLLVEIIQFISNTVIPAIQKLDIGDAAMLSGILAFIGLSFVPMITQPAAITACVLFAALTIIKAIENLDAISAQVNSYIEQLSEWMKSSGVNTLLTTFDDIFTFVYWLFTMDYQHVGRLQRIANGQVEDENEMESYSFQDKESFDNILTGNIKAVLANISGLFDQHSMKTYETNLASITQPLT